MPKQPYKNEATAAPMFRVKLLDSTSTTGAGKTGLTSASAGLIISTIANNEAAVTAYTAAAGKIEAVGTLGTFAEPTATKCRFSLVDNTNHPGVYEIQLAAARYNVANAKSLIVSIQATGIAQRDVEIPLVAHDPYDGVRLGLTGLPNAAAGGVAGVPVLDANSRVPANVQAIADNAISAAAIAAAAVTKIQSGLATAAGLLAGSHKMNITKHQSRT